MLSEGWPPRGIYSIVFYGALHAVRKLARQNLHAHDVLHCFDKIRVPALNIIIGINIRAKHCEKLKLRTKNLSSASCTILYAAESPGRCHGQSD